MTGCWQSPGQRRSRRRARGGTALPSHGLSLNSAPRTMPRKRPNPTGKRGSRTPGSATLLSRGICVPWDSDDRDAGTRHGQTPRLSRPTLTSALPVPTAPRPSSQLSPGKRGQPAPLQTHFTDGKTEPERGYITCPGSVKVKGKLGTQPGSRGEPRQHDPLGLSSVLSPVGSNTRQALRLRESRTVWSPYVGAEAWSQRPWPRPPPGR